jgi:hypothetical protein
VINVKAGRVAANERSRRAARDIDGQTERSKWAGAHESTWATSEFQLRRKNAEPAFARRPSSLKLRRDELAWQALNSESIETRSLPTLTHCFPRNFTFYVAHPIRSIREEAPNVQRRMAE